MLAIDRLVKFLTGFDSPFPFLFLPTYEYSDIMVVVVWRKTLAQLFLKRARVGNQSHYNAVSKKSDFCCSDDTPSQLIKDRSKVHIRKS